MHRLLPLMLVACAARVPTATATPSTSFRAAARQLASVAPPVPGLTVLHTLTPAEGIAVRLTELGGRLYGLAGEAGPNGSDSCSSSANWQTVEHTAHCPGSLFPLALDGSGFRVEHAFSRFDDQARTNADGYHPYGALAVGPDRRLYGVAQAVGPEERGLVAVGASWPSPTTSTRSGVVERLADRGGGAGVTSPGAAARVAMATGAREFAGGDDKAKAERYAPPIRRTAKMSDDKGFDKPRLCAYWEEISPTASAQVASGQLAASVRRLSMVVDELQDIKDEPELEVAVRRLEYHLESYYTRVFMLRDRAINLLGARIGDRKLAKELKNADSTTATRRELNARSPDLTSLVEDLISLLGRDSKLRNMHTHECYFRLGLQLGTTIYDVEDSLPEADDRFREMCSNLVGECVEEYVLKASAIASVVMQILEADKRRM